MKAVQTIDQRIISSSNVDFKARLKTSELLKILQDLATVNAAKNKIWKEEYLGAYGYILVKQTITFHKPIHEYDEVIFSTVPSGSKGIRFYRYYRFEDLEGNCIGEGFSIWTLIDIKNRRLVRPKKLGMEMPEEIEYTHTLDDYHEIKDIDVEYKETRTVRYSNLDTNKHMNNVQYMEWAYDAIEFDYLENKEINEISMNYVKEMPYGTIVDIFIGYDDDYVKVVFKKDDLTYFETGIQFCK